MIYIRENSILKTVGDCQEIISGKINGNAMVVPNSFLFYGRFLLILPSLVG